MFILSIRSNVRQVTADLDRLERKQIPFAQALAVNNLAALVQKAEREEMEDVFDGVTPFTLGGVRVRRARKSDPTATIFLGDIAEAYLAPYIKGGRHFLGGKKGLLNPKAVSLNRFGNIARGRLAALKSKSNVFVGTIKTKNGQSIGGVFQRGNFKVGKRKPGSVPHKAKIVGQKSRLKILIRFTDPEEVKQRLPWFETADRVINANANREMTMAMRLALASAK